MVLYKSIYDSPADFVVFDDSSREVSTSEAVDDIPAERPSSHESSLTSHVAALSRSEEVGTNRDAHALHMETALTQEETMAYRSHLAFVLNTWDTTTSSLDNETTGRESMANTAGVVRVQFPAEPPVRGRQLKHGGLLVWDRQVEDRQVAGRAVLLFENGFQLVVPGTGVIQWYAWTPFAILREDAFPSGHELAGFPCFILYLFAPDLVFEFTAADSDDLTRRRWLDDMAVAIRAFTQSIFPAGTLTEYPLEGLPTPASRILAGYLLLREPDSCVSVLFCVLHAQWEGKAQLSMHANEWCEQPAWILQITRDTKVTDVEGIDSSCFTVGDCLLCARSSQEKMLWLRMLNPAMIGLAASGPDRPDLLSQLSPDRTPSKCLRFAQDFEDALVAEERESVGTFLRREGTPQGLILARGHGKVVEESSPSTLEPDSESPGCDLEASDSEDECFDIWRLQTGETESDRMLCSPPKKAYSFGPQLHRWYKARSQNLLPLVGDWEEGGEFSLAEFSLAEASFSGALEGGSDCDPCEDPMQMLRQSRCWTPASPCRMTVLPL